MKAMVYYVRLTEDQRQELNAEGWDSDIGRRYMNARDGKSLDWALLERAATMEAKSSEAIWVTLQNLEVPWEDNPSVECITDFPRSMDVGDIIMWEDHTMERCARIGFETVIEE